jgi:Uma2 family endonuclease
MINSNAKKISPEEYLKLERAAEYKSDYYDGEIHERARCKPNHNIIAGNVMGELGIQLKKRSCLVFPSDMRIKIVAAGFYGYPDVSVVSGKGEFEDEDNLLNPTVLVEVLSENTETYDRCTKFEFYKKIPTLREFLFIADDHYLVEQYVRIDNRIWRLTFWDRLQDVVKLPSLNCELAVAEIYDKVEFK